MSTQDTTSTPDIISSILLAAWQINAPKPEWALRHLVNPTPSKDYRYLDAIATLCSFVPQCEYASAAIVLGVESNHLYIATSPTAPPTLWKTMPVWIRRMQAIKSANINLESASSSDNNGPVGSFIADVYRICYQNLLDSFRIYSAEDLLEEVSTSSDNNLAFLGLQVDERPSFVEGLTALTTVKEQNIAASSIEEILKLHVAARSIGKFKDHFPGTECTSPASVFSHA